MMVHKMGVFFQKILYPKLTWSRYTSEKKIYLTFDDGPIPDVTEWVLEILKEYEAKATFFCVGDNVRKHPDIFEKVVADGHRIGNHTFNHLVGWQTNLSDYVENVQQCADYLKNVAQQTEQLPLFRPPHGRITFSQIRMLRKYYEIVMWDVLSGDFSPTIGKQNCLNKTLHYTESGSIVVFHDSVKAKENLMYVLPKYLQHFKEKGYLFEIL